MTRTEQRRCKKATKDFLAYMDEFERAAMAEIATMVQDAKHKVLRIEERLYGSTGPANFTKMICDG